MKNLLLLSLIIFFLTSCNFIEEKKNDLGSSVTEKILEKASGYSDIDIADANDLDKNKVVVDIQLNGKNLQDKFKNSFGNITASKESIAITITNNLEGFSDNILLGFTAKDLTASKPIKGNMQSDDSNQTTFQFSLSHASENGMDIKLSQEASGEIIQLTDKKVIIKVSGKLYSMENFETPEKWENYSGTITMEYPAYITMGFKKEDLNY